MSRFTVMLFLFCLSVVLGFNVTDLDFPESTEFTEDSENYTIRCNESVSGYIRNGVGVNMDFAVNVSDGIDVIISNCNSSFDTVMHLMDSDGKDITDQSYNFCDGDDCWTPEYCKTTWSETILMRSLESGLYTIELAANDWFPSINGSFHIDTHCAEGMDLFRVYDGYHCLDEHVEESSSSMEGPGYSVIGCDQSISGHLTCGEEKYFLFSLAEDDNVVITNCHSEFDTTMSIHDILTGRDITKSVTINECDGDHCLYPLYCKDPMYDTETLPMVNLSSGIYALSLSAFSAFSHGAFQVDILCGVSIREMINLQCNYVAFEDGNVYSIETCHSNGTDRSFMYVCDDDNGISLRSFFGSETCSENVLDGVTVGQRHCMCFVH